MSLNQKILVDKIDDDTRVDRFLKRKFPTLTQNFIENKLRKGIIKVNKKKVKSNYKVKFNDIIYIFNLSNNLFSIKKKSIKKISDLFINNFKQSIVYECSDFIIIDKWAGIPSQGGSKIKISIDDIIKKISKDYSLVHRLDKSTSGLLIIAKNHNVAKIFSKSFRDREIKKIYIGVCHGIPKNSTSLVKINIKDKKTQKNLDSITKYKLLIKKNNISLIFFKPYTGRMHQLRLVAKHLNCPIVGDAKYSFNNKYFKEKLQLNAIYLNFIFKNKEYEFYSKIPAYMKNFLKKNQIKIAEKEIYDKILISF